jgi:outer membrane protein assembly factor BamB
MNPVPSGSALRSLLAMFTAATLLLPGVGHVSAQGATPVSSPGSMTAPAGCTVYADGLLNPRFIAFDDSGNLYVTEAGSGGSQAFYAPAATPEAGGATPQAAEASPQAGGEVLTMFGTTGQVTMIKADGSRSVIAEKLPSYTFGTEVVGPAGIAVANGTVYVAIGGPGPATALVPPVEYRDSVIAINPESGQISTVADIGAYERSKNPDPNAVDSNLYGLTADKDGNLFVADAGGNTVYKVDPKTGDFSVLAVLPGVPMQGFKNPARGGAEEIDPVPTDLIPAAGGGVYVGELTGGPFPQGGASILKIHDDGTVEDAAAGLTMVTGLAMARNGQIFAVQLSENFVAQPPAPGSVVKIGAFNKPYPVLTGLPVPNDIAFDGQGNLYVVVNTTSPAGSPPSGAILKCDLLAVPPPAPVKTVEATPSANISGQVADAETRVLTS